MSKVVKLKDVADVITGFPFKGELYSDSGIRTVRGENVTEGRLRWDTVKCWNEIFDKIKEYSLKEHDIVIGMDGSKVGKNKARIRKGDLPLLLAQRVACVRAKPNNDQLFLFYLINNPRFESYVFKTQTGSSVPHISKTQIEDFEIPKISYAVQQKIASVLTSLDDKIELNTHINTELEAMAKTIYDYWFVQFDFPDANGKPYKSSGGKMVYNDVLKREVPEGWEVKKISDISSVRAGGDRPLTFTKEENEECKIPIYSNGITDKGLYGFTNKAIVTSPSLTISARGTIGYCILRSKPFVPIIRLIVVTPALEASLKYFEYCIKSIEFEKSGSVQQQLTVPQVSAIEVLYPSNDILLEFGKITAPIIKQSELITAQNQQLSLLRDWLLPMLMNGQVSVADAYQQAAQALSMAAEDAVKYEMKNKKIKKKTDAFGF